MAQLLEKAASPDVINEAWKRFSRDKAVWQIGLSRNDMMSDIAYHLIKLSNDLKNGVYVPDTVRFFPVNKGDGRKRIISALTLRDKVAQRAALSVLDPIGERFFHHNSYGYRSGRTIDMVISRVREYILCGQTWVVDGDIDSYFDNIPHKPLIKTLKSLIYDRDLVTLIKRWLDVGVPRRGFVSHAKGIPQGAVLSPFLCNVYLTIWDNELSSRNLPFVRFADDFLIFAKSRKEAEKARIFALKALSRLGLTLNTQKTRVAQCGPNITFLGRKLPKLKTA